jgi:hypothetical protein
MTEAANRLKINVEPYFMKTRIESTFNPSTGFGNKIESLVEGKRLSAEMLRRA